MSDARLFTGHKPGLIQDGDAARMRVAMDRQSDVVIVGGGFGGAAAAAVLARHGISVTLLERQAEYEDVVRGEFLGQWGSAEFRRMGLEECLHEGGAWGIKWWHQWDELVGDPDEARILDMTEVSVDGIEEPRSLSHPATCASMWRAARAAGADALMGVRSIRVDLDGPHPVVHYEAAGQRVSRKCRMVIGASGRHAQVARQAGMKISLSKCDRWGGGLAIEGLQDWPDDTQAMGTEGDFMFYVIPQGGGRARLYLSYSFEMVSRFTGPARVSNFLNAFRLKCVPGSDEIADARPAGRLACYPAVWTDTDPIVTDGVVLVGDEAGMNDTILGTGLASALRDARLITEIMCSSSDWSPRAFTPYVAERAQRMQRLHSSAAVMARLYASFTDDSRAMRRRAMDLMNDNQAYAVFLAVSTMGPDRAPEMQFFDYMSERLLAAPGGSLRARASR
jgi:menaquinone-9 beta-reductase